MSTTVQNTQANRRIKVTINSEPEEKNLSPQDLQQLMKDAKTPPKPIKSNLNPLEELTKAFNQSKNQGKQVTLSDLSPELLAQMGENAAQIKPVAEKPIKPQQVITNNVDKFKSSTTVKIENTETSASFEPRIKQEIVKDLGEHAVRAVVASNCIFYPFEDFTIRPFGTPDLLKLWDGARNNREDIIIDLINECISIDVWDFTEKDFRHIMYWERLNSFTRNPYDLTWTSMYGNKNKLTINNSILAITELDQTRAEYEKWLERGFKMPTMRDLNEFRNLFDDLTEQEKFAWVRAKYVSGNSVKEKLANAEKMSPDEYFIDIKEFVQKFENYGVIESCEVTDQHFNADEAILKLEQFNEQNKNLLASDSLSGNELAILLDRITKIDTEIARINDSLSNSGEAAPIRETVTFNINVTDFFPAFL